jgi:hypothetical protein
MILSRFQRLGSWLLWLFLSAQIGGVPSLYIDEMHEYGRSNAISEFAVPAPHSHSHQHQPGTHDEHDQCCILHHGIVGTLLGGSYEIVVLVPHLVFESAWNAPVTEHPIRIDRPPKA